MSEWGPYESDGLTSNMKVGENRPPKRNLIEIDCIPV